MRSVLVLIAASLMAFPAERRDLRYETTPGRKIALVAGNAAYPKWPLRNPVNDARSMQAALGELGFQTELALDAGRKDLERTVERFVSRIQPGDVALFYYAGHGIQLDGENYLVPIDFDAKDEVDAKYMSYSASRLEERMERAGARLSILVLDACRNNPFRPTRAAGGGGLAVMNSGKGALIAFATSPGRTADDNASGENGLFTGHLVRALREPGLSLDQVFNRVRERVYAESGERQLPWTVSSVIGEFYFRGGAAKAAGAKEVPLATALSALTAGAPAVVVPAGQSQSAMALFEAQQYGAFRKAAEQELEKGAELSFLLGHHHTLTGVHGAVLRISAKRIAFETVGNASVCNQKALQAGRNAIVAAQVVHSARQEIFLNLKLRGDDGKIRNFNFADGLSTVDRSDGLPLVVSPARAEAALQAIAELLKPQVP